MLSHEALRNWAIMLSTTSGGKCGDSSTSVTKVCVIWYSTSFEIDSPVEDFEEPEMISKKDWKMCSIRDSDPGMSVSRTILLTSARETNTYLCCVLYALEGSERAGKMDVMKRVNMSWQHLASYSSSPPPPRYLTYLQLRRCKWRIWRANLEHVHQATSCKRAHAFVLMVDQIVSS